MRNKLVFLAFLLALYAILPVFPQQESLTITTYYPAPFGVYQNLRLFPTTTVPTCAAANDEGVMYYDDTANVNQLMVCRETAPGVYGWGVSGSNWTHPSGTNFLYTNNPDWNVGIGTEAPERQLHLKGVNPIILFEDDEIETGTTELTNFMIQADNAAGRLISQQDAAIFIDSDNNDSDARAFWVLKNDSWFSTQAVQLFKVQQNGKVAIGAGTPQNKLDIAGAAVVGGGYAATNTAPENGLLVQGKVGINTTDPKNFLDVNGAAIVRGNHIYLNNPATPLSGGKTQGNWGFVVDTADGRFTIGQRNAALHGDDDGGFIDADRRAFVIFPNAKTGSIQIKSSGKVIMPYGWDNADYVFEPGYNLMPINKLADYIRINRHLPGMDEIKGNEVAVTDILKKLTEKIEELTLYTVQQNEKIKTLEKRIKELTL